MSETVGSRRAAEITAKPGHFDAAATSIF